MQTKINDYLIENRIKHAYIIKAIEEKNRDFEFITDKVDPKNFAGIWHEDQIITLHGSVDWCQERFDRYFGQYNYYDMNSELVDQLYTSENVYERETHFLMKLDRTFDITSKVDSNETHAMTTVNSRVAQLNIHPLVKRVGTVNSTSRYQLVEAGGRVLGKVLIECVSSDVFIISEMLINKKFRRHGLALYFIKEIILKLKSTSKSANNLEQQKSPEFILYVDKKNLPALKLYSRLGFRVIGTYENLVIDG